MLSAQVAINSYGTAAHGSAMLDISSTDKGVLVPRMSKSQRDNIDSPQPGLLIYQYSDTPGFYYYDGVTWRVVGYESIDINSLADGKTGGGSVFLGSTAGNVDDGIDNYNVGIGDFALSNNTSGGANTSVGTWSLAANTTGVNNTAFGFGALSSNISGNYNTAFGIQCLAFNTTDSANTAFGYQAGKFVTGGGNVFLGYQAGKNETGSNKLYISNSDTVNPLIYGDFSTDELTINGDMAIHQVKAIDGNGLELLDDGGNGIFIEDGGNVGIGTSSLDASASFEVSSTTGGFLPPRMTTTQLNTISNPTAGLMVYNTSVNSVCFYNGSIWKNMSSDGESCGTITYEGQTYETIIIGIRCWMAENLNVGTRIDGVNAQANNSTIEKYCYNDIETNCDTYGGLYQWDEMMQYVSTQGTQGICPSGWHIPSDADWTVLTTYLGGVVVAGGMMKDTGTVYWAAPNTGATNSSGFTGLPGGFRYSNGSFYDLGFYGYWWSSTEYSGTLAWYRNLGYDYGQVGRYNYGKSSGFSVRCLKD